MKKIILFGAGFYGHNAYYKMSTQFEIVYFADNNLALDGTEILGVPVIAGNRLKEVFTPEMDIVICARKYFEIGAQLIEMGITEYFVMLEGFLYHNSPDETMMPFEPKTDELQQYISKENHEKNILFVQNTACIRTHKIAAIVKNAGYKAYLLYTMAPPEVNNYSFADSYSGIYTFYTMEGILNFINNSNFDIVHSSNAPDILTNLVLGTSKHVVFDTHDMNSLWRENSIEDLVLEYIANTKSDGNIYTSQRVAEIAKKKYGLEKREVISLENMILEQQEINNPYTKLSIMDHEIHCVYEGGINGKDKTSDRFFEPLWKKITDCGIHIHFYSQSDYKYCKELETKSRYLHYEGNLGTKELIPEMTKYDCGLAIFNINNQNRLFLETGTANKMYEYINAGLPVVVGDVQSYIDFVEKFNVGKMLNFEKDIKSQIVDITKIIIEKDFLKKNKLTMMSRSQELIDFYERVRKRKVIR